jgi:hypothetical protein
MAGQGQKETKNHVRCHGSFRRKRPWYPHRHGHTTTITSRRPNDPRQHPRQWRAVARRGLLAVPPPGDHGCGPVARSRAGAIVRATHGMHPMRHYRCRRPAELAGTATAREPDRGAMAVSAGIDRLRIAPGRGWAHRSGERASSARRGLGRISGLPAAWAVLTRSNATPTAIGYPVSASGDDRCGGGSSSQGLVVLRRRGRSRQAGSSRRCR